MATQSWHPLYNEYPHLYDHIVGDRSPDIALIKGLIRKHHPKAKQVLELACGTGSVMEGLQDAYQVTGLDSAQNMLTIAKRRMPHAPMYLADMADFHLGQKFDVIYCIQSSINHLLPFSDWESMFACVANQLKRGGILIFDVNAFSQLNMIRTARLQFHRADEDYVVTKLTEHPEHEGRYIWEVRIFTRKDPYSFTYRPTIVEMSAYPEEEVVRVLRSRFTVLDVFNLKRAVTSEDLSLTYFVYRKL